MSRRARGVFRASGVVFAAALLASCSKDRVPRRSTHEPALRASPALEQRGAQADRSLANPSAEEPHMVKLYKRQADGRLAYHEAWYTDSGITEHWGMLGERGQIREHTGRTLEEVLAEARRQGFSKADAEHVVVIEYEVQGMGTREDLEKRHALEARMDETLGWTGLGHCDGGSIGSGMMEVTVMVVDVELAKRTIVADLAGTPFQDYRQIYVEDLD